MPAEFIQNQDVFWKAVQDRDAGFDGRFFFGVLTTGVYCRPSCACRLPLRKNVRFFKDVVSAERAGLRACKRCRPNEASVEMQHAERIRTVVDYIHDHAGDALPLAELAAHAGLSSFHFQRSFKAVMGVSPKQFVDGCRLESFKGQLRGDRSITDAIYAAGFGSGSRVYERVDTHLGMTPAQYRTGGKDLLISHAAADSILGRMMIGATDRGICFVQFGNSDEDLVRILASEYPKATIEPMPKHSAHQFEAWMMELTEHLAGAAPSINLPLDLRATAFQMRVWRHLQSIPYGSLKSYSEVATDLGQPNAARAVARACAANRVALLIPCHRVIRGSGDLAGYKWGLDRKRTLIDQERRHANRQ